MEKWHSGICDCCSDPCGCCGMMIFMIPVFSVPGVGSALQLPNHTGFSNCVCFHLANSHPVFTAMNFVFDCPCGGRDMVGPCWINVVLETMVKQYNLPYPEPCRDSECFGSGTKCQGWWCGACTLCLIHRELKARGKL